MRIPLDMAGRHAVTVRIEGPVTTLELVHATGDRRSTVDDVLVRELRVKTPTGLACFDEATRAVRVASDADAELVLAGVSVATVRAGVVAGRAVEPSAEYGLLSPFELRYAADNGALHPIPREARGPISWTPTTDLHTHFAACLRGRDLVELGAIHGVVYPRPLFEEAGLHVPGDVALADLPAPLRDRLATRLDVPLDRRITFLEMERIYRLRSPITKARPLLVPLCERIARDYASMGARYVELSVGNVVEADVLRTLHAALPRIEAKTGVTLRFLAAISRHDDPEWDRDLVARIQTLGESRYLVGIDVMGHETNSTRAFEPVLRALARWADRESPGFVLRVHAGESPSHPENVRLAVRATEASAVELRIGHGLYGVDDETLDALLARRAIVEFNLDSNVALNHAHHARDIALRRYVDAGLDVVLGSDGYGLYQTSLSAAARAALVVGLERRHLVGALARTEASVLARAEARTSRKAASFVVPDDVAPVHFTAAIVDARRAREAARDAALEERLAALRIDVVSETASVHHDRRLVAFAGAWRKSWDAIGPGERKKASEVLTELVLGFDPERTVLLTGGTRFGVEGLVARAAIPRGIPVVGALVRETPVDAIDGTSMTHACFVGETLYDKASGLYALVAARKGAVVVVGGGQIVSDEVQTAKNLRLDVLLFDGISGASARHAIDKPGSAFQDAATALSLLEAWGQAGGSLSAASGLGSHWFEGPNPTVDAVLLRRAPRAEVLLVLRHRDAPAEPGKWALPGGFVASRSRRGQPFVPAETLEEACRREVAEETGLVVDPDRLVRVGVFEGGGRDPRDTPRAWSRSTVFLVDLGQGSAAHGGADDAADTRWFPIDALPEDLAFDHRAILAQVTRTVAAP